MKQNLTYLFAVLCMACLFTACSKDEGSNSSGDWRDISGTYDNSKTLALKMGEATIPAGGKSVTIEAASADKASVVLNNVLPESKSVTISADTDLSAVMSMFSIQYGVVDGKCMLALDKNYIDLALGLAGSRLEELGIPAEDIVRMLVDIALKMLPNAQALDFGLALTK